jgi:hypothetical protein
MWRKKFLGVLGAAAFFLAGFYNLGGPAEEPNFVAGR